MRLVSHGDAMVLLATMKYTSARPLANPENAAPKLVEIASGIQSVQDGRVLVQPHHTTLRTRHRAGLCPVEYKTTNNQTKRAKPCGLPDDFRAGLCFAFGPEETYALSRLRVE